VVQPDISCTEDSGACAQATLSDAPEGYLVPHFLLRIAGLPESAVRQLRFSQTSESIDAVLATKAALLATRDEICAMLYGLVPRTEDPRLRRDAITAKRAVFNLQDLRATKVDEARLLGALPEEHRLRLGAWLEQLRSLAGGIAAGRVRFDAERRDKRARLREIVRFPDFFDAQIVTNPVVARALADYARDDGDDELDRRKRRTELTATKLIYRTAYRSTPLSTMALVAYGFWRRGSPEQVRLDTLWRKRTVRLNHALVSGLRTAIERQLGPEEGRLRVNPTVDHDGEYLVWLKSIVGLPSAPWFSFVPKETYVRARVRPDMLAVVDSLRGRARGRTRGEVVRMVSADLQLDEAVVSRTIAQMLEQDILQLLLPCWDLAPDNVEELVHALKHTTSTQARTVEEAMGKARLALEELPAAVGEVRTASWNALHYAVQGAAAAVGLDLQGLERRLVFEDACASVDPLTVSGGRVADSAAVLSLIAKMAYVFDTSLYVRLTTRALLRGQGQVGRSIPLLDLHRLCLKHYAAHVYGREAAILRDPSQLPGAPSSELKDLSELRSSITKFLHESVLGVDRGEVALHPRRLEQLLLNAETRFERAVGSIGFIVQAVETSSGEKLAINNVLPGFGKGFCRYCSLFGEGEESLQASVSREVARAAGRRLVLDLGSAFGFTGNLRKPPTDYVLAYVRTDAPEGTARLISLSDLSVTMSQNGELALHSRQLNREICVIDFGFMMPALMPPLYRFLSFLAPAVVAPMAPLLWELEASGTRHWYPRIVIGDVILRHRRWSVRPGDFPQCRRDWTGFDHMLEAREWLARAGIPRVVSVVQLSQELIDAIVSGKPVSQLDARHLKTTPVTIDFDNYFSLQIFEKMCDTAGQNLILEEVLPLARQSRVSIRGEAHHSEFGIEVRLNS
jgi:Lantibiotic dehydratase, N terminus